MNVSTDQLVILDVTGYSLVRHWYVAYLGGKQLPVVAQTL